MSRRLCRRSASSTPRILGLQLLHNSFAPKALELGKPKFPAVVGIALPQLLRRGSKFRRPDAHPALTDLQTRPERLAPDSTYFCEPMGINPCSNAATNRFGAPDYRAILSG
jgi:hypothetical protein